MYRVAKTQTTKATVDTTLWARAGGMPRTPERRQGRRPALRDHHGGGSGGSPCFDEAWQPVTIHRAEQARLFGAVREGVLLSRLHAELGIDVLNRDWARDRTDLERLDRLLGAIRECLETVGHRPVPGASNP